MKILPTRFALDIDAHESARLLAHHFVHERAREALDRGPARPRIHRDDDVKALAAREPRERVQPERLEAFLDGCAASTTALARHVLGRIQIEDDNVGLIEMLRPRAPDVQLEHAYLRERLQGSEVVEHRVRIFVFVNHDARAPPPERPRRYASDRSTAVRSPRGSGTA